MDTYLTIACLVVVSTLSGVAVFHPDFDDTLLERICLTGICIGALGLAYEVCKTQTVSSSITWLSVCAAGYALEVGRKYK